MLSLYSRPWPSGPDLQEHRPRQIRPSSLPTPKYFPVTEYVTRTRPASTLTTTDASFSKQAQPSLPSSSYSLYSTSVHPQYSTQWYHRRRSSGRASAKPFTFHKYRSTRHNPRTPQSKHRRIPATRYIPFQDTTLLLSMVSKKASARVPATFAPPKKKTRKGRLVAYPTGIVPVELRPGYKPDGDNQSSEPKDTEPESASLQAVQLLQHNPSSAVANIIEPSSVVVEPTSSVNLSKSQCKKSTLATPPPDPTDSIIDSEPQFRKQPRSTGNSVNMVSNNPASQLPTPDRTATPSSRIESSVKIAPPPPMTTPAGHIELIVESSSDLSSAPDSIGTTPEGFLTRRARLASSSFQNASPTRRSGRIRKRSIKANEAEDSNDNTKRRKLSDTAHVDILPSIEESPEQLTSIESSSPDSTQNPSSTDSSSPLTRKRKAADVDEAGDDNDHDTKTPDVPHKKSKKTKIVKKPVQKLSKAAQAEERRFYQDLEKELATVDPRSRKIWTNFKPNRVIMYGADGHTQYTPAYAASAGSAGSASRGGKSNGRGGSRGGRGGATSNRGRHTRARGRGRDEDSPEPPLPKRTQPNDDAMIIKYAKARQAELRKLFSIVGTQQSEILGSLATRDLTRLAKKPKAHKQVPEYEELLEELERKKKLTQDMITEQYKIAVEAEELRLEGEKAAVENTCKIRITDLHQEYQKGAQGDLIIFRRAVDASRDETRTQDGSETDYFPHYHDLPEPNEHVRGYTSTRITDERPFKHHLLTFDDEARREVIEDDVGPIIQAFAQKNAERRAEEERKKTQTMEALSEEAERQLKEVKGYLIRRPMWREEDVNSYALSCLADVSEWMRGRYPDKQYVYMPLEDGETFPKEALHYEKVAGKSVAVLPFQPPPPAEAVPLAQRPGPRSFPQAVPAPLTIPPLTTQATRRSLRNLQPNGPLVAPLSQPPTPTQAHQRSGPPTPAPSSTVGPALAPAPPKLGPALSANHLPRPPAIDTRAQPLIPTPPERSPVHPPQNQPAVQSVHGLPPLQPRHMSQSALPPPPPGYGYPQPFSPTHPPPSYPPPTHHGLPPPPYQPGPPPSPYHHQYPMPPSPYTQHTPQPYNPYPPQPYYGGPAPPPQQYSFMPPQQGPAASQVSPTTRPHSRSLGSVTAPMPPHTQAYPQDPYRDGYHHSRNLSQPFPPPPIMMSAAPTQPPAPVPPHTTSHAKSRARAKAKQPVTFVNQTLATRKAAAEQLAREAAAAAAERKDKDKLKRAESAGRKLAPKP